MSKLNQPGVESRRRSGGRELQQKRADTLTLGLGAFQKISAVEGIRVSDRLVSDLRTMAKQHPGEAARTRYIADKYGKK